MSQLSADDHLAIREIIATYCHALDLGRWEEFVDLFSDDCRLDFGSLMGVYEGREGVRRFGERIQGLGLFMRHYTTNVVVRGDGERARAECYVLAVTGPPARLQDEAPSRPATEDGLDRDATRAGRGGRAARAGASGRSP